MNVEIKTEDERQEMLRALRLAKRYTLPGTPDMKHIERQLQG